MRNIRFVLAVSLRVLFVSAVLMTGWVAEAATLYPAGYSGFGTATPTAKLDVVGDVKVSGKVRIPQSGDLVMGSFTSGTSPAS